MKDYSKGKIYTIRCKNDDTLIYVGSTVQPLYKRLGEHKYNSKRHPESLVYSTINNEWNSWYIELYEVFPCNSKEELNKREGEVIRLIGTLNHRIAGRSQKEWRNDNADKIKEKNKEYSENNTDKMKEYQKEYYENNADKIKEKKKKYYENNADKRKEYQKEYSENNADKMKEYQKEYRENNADQIKENKKVYREKNADKIKEYNKEYYQRKKLENKNLA